MLSRPHTTIVAALALALALAPGCKKKETVAPEEETWTPDESAEPPSTYSAASSTMTEEERTEQAKQLYTQAEEKAGAEDWAAALPLYEQAYQLLPEKHGFALKVGDTATKLGDCPKATIYYQHFLNYADAKKYASDIKRVKKLVEAGCQ